MTAAIRLQWFTAGYGWVTVVAPIVIASPVYFAGDLTFGGLMMAAAAFTQVHSVAALVRRQHRRHRRLARDAAARGVVPAGADQGGVKGAADRARRLTRRSAPSTAGRRKSGSGSLITSGLARTMRVNRLGRRNARAQSWTACRRL